MTVNRPRSIIRSREHIRWRNKINALLHWNHITGIGQDNEDLSSTILISGVGRSGTTWVTELLAYALDARILFEPMQYAYTDFRKIGSGVLIPRPWEQDLYKKVLQKVLSGHTPPNFIVDKLNSPKTYSCRIVKDLRLSYTLGFIKECFPEVTTIHIYRHPYACLRNQVQIASADQLEISREYNQELRNHPVLKETLWQTIKPPKISDDVLEYKIFAWCTTQAWVLFNKELHPSIHMISYEELCQEAA